MATQNILERIVSPKIVNKNGGFVANADIVNVDNITFNGILRGPMGPITGGGTGIIAYGTTGCNIDASGITSTGVNIVGPSGLTSSGIVMVTPTSFADAGKLINYWATTYGPTNPTISVNIQGTESGVGFIFNYAVLKL